MIPPICDVTEITLDISECTYTVNQVKSFLDFFFLLGRRRHFRVNFQKEVILHIFEKHSFPCQHLVLFL